MLLNLFLSLLRGSFHMKRWLCVLFLSLCPLAASAAYPEKPITVIIGFPAGSAPDVAARLVVQKLAPRLGQPVVVENRAGAAGTIGTAAVARAEPNGYTLLFGSASALTVGHALYKNPGFDPVKSFAPIIQILRGAFIFSVRSELPVNNIKELIQYSKQRPGQLTYGSSGNGSLHHLCVEMLKSATGIDVTHVPYRGSPQSWLALQTGEIDIICDSMPNPIPALQAGKARPIAVTGDKHLDLAPKAATFKEQGYPDVNIDFWYGFLAPAGTPAAIVEKLNTEIAAVLKDQEIINRYKEQGIEILSTGKPQEFGRLIAREAVEWPAIVKKIGVRID
jgi:tripartite-type tricarboxylate transporter receptor subunit TctC